MDQIFNWQSVALILGGVIGARVIGWLASWLNGKGAELVDQKLEKLQDKLNQNSVLAQVTADDAVIDILQQAIPDVIHEATEDIREALKDGKIDSVEWKAIGAKLWEKSKDHIRGGKNDYLANSSFADGTAIATIVAQRFFKKQKAQKDGLIVEAPRAETK